MDDIILGGTNTTRRNAAELRSFFGLANFHAKFVANFQSRCAPLYELVNVPKSKWIWNSEHKHAFLCVKEALKRPERLVTYSNKLPLVLMCGASERGLGAAFFHDMGADKVEPIGYASRLLNEAEKHYVPIEREPLSIVFGIEKFHQYLFGRSFVLKTDHKPRKFIFGERRDLPRMTNNRLVRCHSSCNNTIIKSNI
ncbi:hypothetical protein ACOME3_007438 [Neoechinorhynchus agilis]